MQIQKQFFDKNNRILKKCDYMEVLFHGEETKPQRQKLCM